METIKSWYHRIDVQVDRLIRQYKRKKFLLKAKVFLLFVLPVLILLIGVKAAKTWMRIKVRGIPIPEASSGSSGDRAKPVCDTRTCWKTSS